MKRFLKILPWLFVALFATEIIAVFAPKKDGEYHVREFGRFPVLLNGRIQPFDSVGKNTLLQLRSTGDLPLEEVPSWKFWHHAKKLKPTEWLLEVMFRPEVADTRPAFLIHHPELLGELNLSDKGIKKSALRYFTFNELATNVTASSNSVLREIMSQARELGRIEEKDRTPLQKQLGKLAHAVMLYDNLKGAICPPGWDDFEPELKAFQDSIKPGMAAMQAKEAKLDYDEAAFDRLWRPLSFFFQSSKDPGAGQMSPLVVPPMHPEVSRDNWVTVPTGLLEMVRDGEPYPPIKALAAIASGYHTENAPQFNAAVGAYKDWLVQHFPREAKKGRQELFYNDVKAFLHAMIIDLFAFMLAAGALLTFNLAPNISESLRRSAFWLVLLAWLVHTFGLIFRMYLEGRPPVTNLYSSAIFIGWGAIVLGLILERVFRVGIGVAVASLTGALTLIIAHNLAITAENGDTMQMMRAVLDTNVWLATHVVVETLGYASTFVAGLLAIFYIVLGVFTPVLAAKNGKLEISKALGKMVYAIVCFATLFTFVGTVLGGIWADQSWGRFWGWDPKENGALIIVLWNVIVLHARWGGMIKERGLMNMAVIGNIVTSWSWFGVNMLGIGLHSYGFMDSAFKWLVAFIASQLALIALGLLPTRYWQSFRGKVPPGDSPTTPKPQHRLKPA
jgi:ABC-type transport system involved in cytochrome c biogenesis permease subunit